MTETDIQSPPRALRIALVGSPNSGKTTLFNSLTGLRAKTGNYAGVTVERSTGQLMSRSRKVELIDLPGTYSLDAISEDESVAIRVLRGEFATESPPDGVACVIDSTTLERSLPLLAEVLAVGRPTVLVLTMIDELKARGGDIDIFRLQDTLGIPVVGVVGTRGIGIADLSDLLIQPDKWTRHKVALPSDISDRFAWADRVLNDSTRTRPQEHKFTRRLDKLLLHPILGPLVFLAFLVVFFQAIFSWAGPAMDFFAGTMDDLADYILQQDGSDSAFTSLLANGVIRGVGGVIVFLPQILLLFAVILFLEACGYMARAAFVIDRVMGWIGLEGRCFIALLSSYACAVPGILATRTIPNPKDRLATVLVAPLTTCSARLPVYLLLITAFVPADPLIGPFDMRAATLFGLYLLGAVSTMVCAAILKKGMLRGANLPFYMELPPYRLPSLRSIALGVWERARVFIVRAGTVILAASVVLWILLNFPKQEAKPGMDEAQAQRIQLEQSYAATIGRSIEPIFEPMGFDWRVNVGLLGSFAAREVMNSTLAEIYAYSGDLEEVDGLASVITAKDPVTGKPPLERASAFALLVFFVFALQCISTIAAIRRETNSWRWPLFALAYMTALAWVGGWVTYWLTA